METISNEEALGLIDIEYELKAQLSKAKQDLSEANRIAGNARKLKKGLEHKLYMLGGAVVHDGIVICVRQGHTNYESHILLMVTGVSSDRKAWVERWDGADHCGISFHPSNNKPTKSLYPADLDESLKIAKDFVAHGDKHD